VGCAQASACACHELSEHRLAEPELHHVDSDQAWTRTKRRKRRKSPVICKLPFENCDRVNAVWCIDFKGKFRTRDGIWCHVLTVEDAYSRFLIRAEALTEPNGAEVERVLDGAFQEFGIPDAIRSDNGPPFASTGAGGLTALSVWWLKLGIRLERIEPGKPQQNGRLERLHRTLEEVVGSPAKNVKAQGREISFWRQDYNEVRPHEALGMRVPADAYQRSRRRYPTKLIDLRYSAIEPDLVERLDKQGRVKWRGHKILVSSGPACHRGRAEDNRADACANANRRAAVALRA